MNTKKEKVSLKFFLTVLFLAVGLFFVGAKIFGCESSTDGGAFKSSDGGDTWEQKVSVSDKSSLSRKNVLTVAVNPKDSNVIYLGLEGGGIYKSKDAGDNWQRVLPADVDIYSIAIDPKDPNYVYASSLSKTNGKIYKSPDAFEDTFQEILIETKREEAIVDVEIDSYDTSRIYAVSAQGGVFKSTDFGETWSAKAWFEKTSLTSISIGKNDSRNIFVGSLKHGVFKTEDGGEKWFQMKDQLDNFDKAEIVHDVAIDPSDDNHVYIGTDYGLLETKDKGNTWSAVNTLIAPKSAPVNVIAIDPSNANVIYLGAGSSVHKSYDKGSTWKNWLLPTERLISDIAIDYNNSNNLYVGVIKRTNK